MAKQQKQHQILGPWIPKYLFFWGNVHRNSNIENWFQVCNAKLVIISLFINIFTFYTHGKILLGK